MAVDFSAFKENLDMKSIEQMEKDYKPNSGSSYSELPSGVYPVAIEKMEVKSQDGKFGHFDQINIDFKITDDEYKGQHIFYNGTFNNKIDSGYAATARLLSEMTDGELDENSILYNITKDVESVAEYILDLFQVMVGHFEYDLNLDIKEQTDINPNTGKPYKPNKFFSIKEVYDV